MNPTEEQLIADLKAKYGKVITVTIPLDEDDETKVLKYHLKKPDNKTRAMISKLADSSSEKAVIAGYNALRIGGDEVAALQANDDALISAGDALIEVLKVQKAVIKKN
jgi:Mg-chelatase subunit ChlI